MSCVERNREGRGSGAPDREEGHSRPVGRGFPGGGMRGWDGARLLGAALSCGARASDPEAPRPRARGPGSRVSWCRGTCVQVLPGSWGLGALRNPHTRQGPTCGTRWAQPDSAASWVLRDGVCCVTESEVQSFPQQALGRERALGKAWTYAAPQLAFPTHASHSLRVGSTFPKPQLQGAEPSSTCLDSQRGAAEGARKARRTPGRQHQGLRTAQPLRPGRDGASSRCPRTPLWGVAGSRLGPRADGGPGSVCTRPSVNGGIYTRVSGCFYTCDPGTPLQQPVPGTSLFLSAVSLWLCARRAPSSPPTSAHTRDSGGVPVSQPLSH